MYIRSASLPSTVLWAFHTIQPYSSDYICHFQSFSDLNTFMQEPKKSDIYSVGNSV